MTTFTILGRLPGLNEIIAANRSNRYTGAKLKRETEDVILWSARQLSPVHGPVSITIDWHEPNDKRDPDNVCAGIKFVLDALVRSSVIDGDGRATVKSITHRVMTDRENPRVVVMIEEES